MTEDDIEVHFNAKNGELELSCGPESFSAYRDLAKKHLKDFNNIDFGDVVEIQIIDAQARDAEAEPGDRSSGVVWVVALLLFAVLTAIFAVIGVFTVAAKAIN